MNANTDLLIIGAGQAGLALAYHLQSTSLRYTLVDGHARIGDSWRKRYDTLTLFTPRWLSTLPGLPLPGEQNGYATRDEFADYLEAYAHHFALPVLRDTKITKLEQAAPGFQANTAAGGVLPCRAVVLATGAFQQPVIPALANQLAATVAQFTTETYKNRVQVPVGTVLVVGDGASGRDIASELSATHQVLLATGRPRRLLPEQLFGQNIWWWLKHLGLLSVSGNNALGRLLQKVDPFPARGRETTQLTKQGVQIMPRLVAATGDWVTFANGQRQRITTIVWAIGYRDDSAWVAIPAVKDEEGNFIHQAGLSPVPHLYFLGRPWQRTRSSALITGANADAHYLKEQIIRSFRQAN
ncbi:MAG: NAD(P)-binding domain-containing protein [Caldilineaceae bacterium]|nr:NAD(P)-binding domain-containing protein [Caldilineaceae bacterium]